MAQRVARMKKPTLDFRVVGVGAVTGSVATLSFLSLHIPIPLSIALGVALAVILAQGLAER